MSQHFDAQRQGVALDEHRPGQATKDKPSMHVLIHSPFREYYNDQAYSLSARNATGPFDVLPHHHSFISLLPPGEITIHPVAGQERKILISGGVLHVKKDQVVVFLDV